MNVQKCLKISDTHFKVWIRRRAVQTTFFLQQNTVNKNDHTLNFHDRLWKSACACSIRVAFTAGEPWSTCTALLGLMLKYIAASRHVSDHIFILHLFALMLTHTSQRRISPVKPAAIDISEQAAACQKRQQTRINGNCIWFRAAIDWLGHVLITTRSPRQFGFEIWLTVRPGIFKCVLSKALKARRQKCS